MHGPVELNNHLLTVHLLSAKIPVLSETFRKQIFEQQHPHHCIPSPERGFRLVKPNLTTIRIYLKVIGHDPSDERVCMVILPLNSGVAPSRKELQGT